MTEEELAAVYDDRCCPFCDRKGLFLGPVGGASVNVRCDRGAVLNILDPRRWNSLIKRYGGSVPRIGQVIEGPRKQ